jgi:hypothetical protein
MLMELILYLEFGMIECLITYDLFASDVVHDKSRGNQITFSMFVMP